ncbi:hypothetical protein H0X10_01305 [Candidatus Saccharibacteria bacterium]|nr:hypothetical protein [Candidatus Saccharibacteria bacterium]
MNPQQTPQNQNIAPQISTQQVYNQPPSGLPPQTKPSKKKLFILIGTGVGLLGLLVVIAVLVGGSEKKPTPQTATTNDAKSELLEPAKALDIEQTNNAISQDMSNLNNDKDFPADQLSDKALGL